MCIIDSFWGPPGVGKTTLASIIAKRTNADFVNFSAVTSGIKEIKEVMARAELSRRSGLRTLVFVDEIHRFNKAQQDAFLPYVAVSYTHLDVYKRQAGRSHVHPDRRSRRSPWSFRPAG